MSPEIENRIAAMGEMSIGRVREEYEHVFGESTTSRSARYLIRRIVWRMQANEQGGLPLHARQRAAELADMTELRLTAPKEENAPPSRILPVSFQKTNDLPVGAQMERIYKGQKILVTIVENGVRWEGELYRSLSAVAKKVTGSHCSGRAFFGLTARRQG